MIKNIFVLFVCFLKSLTNNPDLIYIDPLRLARVVHSSEKEGEIPLCGDTGGCMCEYELTK